MTFWVLVFIAEMLEVKGTLYFFDTFMEKRDGGYRNRYRFFVYCGVLYLVAVTGAWIGMLKCIPIILVMSFLNLAYYEVSFRQSFLFSIINYTNKRLSAQDARTRLVAESSSSAKTVTISQAVASYEANFTMAVSVSNKTQ